MGKSCRLIDDFEEQFLNILKSNCLTRRDVVYIFAKLRALLELDAVYKQRYPILNLYCNWCFHTRLSQSKTIYQFLIAVSNALYEASGTNPKPDYCPSKSTADLVDTASNILQIPELRKNISDVLVDHKIPSGTFNTKFWWDAFLHLLLLELVDKPLSFPEKVITGTKTDGRGFDFFQKIAALPCKDLNKVIRLKIELDDQGGKHTFKLHFETMSKNTLIFGIDSREPSENFVPPRTIRS